MKRGGSLKRVPLKRENRPRKAENHQRAYGGPERIAWIQSQPSVVSGERPCVNAHVKTGGAGRKADARWIVPLTDAEHQELHRIGQRSFEAAHHIDLLDLAAIIDARWEVYRAQQERTAALSPGEARTTRTGDENA